MCICAKTKELKDLIIQHPELPIVFMCNWEICYDNEYQYYSATYAKASLGRILEVPDPPKERCWTDERDFEEEIENIINHMYGDDVRKGEMTKEEYQQKLQAEKDRYKGCWKDCIIVYLEA